MGTRGAVYDAIQQAQQLALKKICLQKYKHLYEELSAAQQRKIRSGFKVLFQQTF
jgi:D-serine dehydratase